MIPTMETAGGLPDDERALWVACMQVPGLGPVKFARLLERFGTAVSAWSAGDQELRTAGLDGKTADAFVAYRRTNDPTALLSRAQRSGIDVLTLRDPAYPSLLKEIYAPPPVLFVRGELLTEDRLSVAVVGTRTATAYGKLIAERLVSDLVRHAVTIVSGLARGIDAIAHRTALQAGGRTVAVLGSGVDVIYPGEHRALADAIVKNGALLSEYLPGAKPERDNFPARNRLIAGMTMGTIIVEAGDVSGALITARMALEHNREVFAVPGNVTSQASVGTNALIRRGEAKLISRVEDVLEELNPGLVAEQLQLVELLPENATESVLLEALTTEPQHVDELSRSTGIAIAAVTSTLTMLELKGAARHAGGMTYTRMR